MRLMVRSMVSLDETTRQLEKKVLFTHCVFTCGVPEPSHFCLGALPVTGANDVSWGTDYRSGTQDRGKPVCLNTHQQVSSGW